MELINEKLSWDTTDLGVYPKTSIIKKWSYEKSKYIIIETDDGLICGSYQKYTTGLPLIIEQLREVFGLHKIGIHLITIGTIKYILYRTSISGTYVLLNMNIKSYPLIDQISSTIKKLFLFNELLNLSDATESNIVINGTKIYNINDQKLVDNSLLGYNSCVLNRNVIGRWFLRQSFDVTLQEMLFGGSRPSDNKTEQELMRIRQQIEDIIVEYDPNYMWYAKSIMEKVVRYLF